MVDIGSFNAATKGMASRIGTQQALSSTISTFGLHFIKGIYVGIQHVKALGGPNFTLTRATIGLYDPQRGIANALAFNQANIPVVLDSYEGDATASLPTGTSSKILALEPEQRRCPAAGQQLPVLLRRPRAVRGWLHPWRRQVPVRLHAAGQAREHPVPNAPGLGTALETAATTALKAAGISSSTFEFTSGQTDWSQQINEIRSDNADFVDRRGRRL